MYPDKFKFIRRAVCYEYCNVFCGVCIILFVFIDIVSKAMIIMMMPLVQYVNRIVIIGSGV